MVSNSGAVAPVQQKKTLEQLFDEAPLGADMDFVFPGLFGASQKKVVVRKLADGTVAFKAHDGNIRVPEVGTALQYQMVYALEAGKQRTRADATMSNLNNAEKEITKLKGQLKENQQESDVMRRQLLDEYKNFREKITPIVDALKPLAIPDDTNALQGKQDFEYIAVAYDFVKKYVPIAAKGAVNGVKIIGKLQGELATAQSKATTLQQILDSFGGAEKLKTLKAFEVERTQFTERLNAAEEKAKAYKGLPDPSYIKVVLEEAAKRGTAPVQKRVTINVDDEEVSIPEKYVNLVKNKLALAAHAAELEKAGYKALADVNAALEKVAKDPETRAKGLEQALGVYRAINPDPSALQKKVTEYNATRAKLEADLNAARTALQAYEQTGLKAGEVGEIAGANKGLVARVKELEQQAAAAAAPQGASAQPQAPAPQGPAAPQVPATTYAYRPGLFASTTVHYDGRDVTGYPVGNQFLDSKTGKPAELPPEMAAGAIKYHNAKGKPGKLRQ